MSLHRDALATARRLCPTLYGRRMSRLLPPLWLLGCRTIMKNALDRSLLRPRRPLPPLLRARLALSLELLGLLLLLYGQNGEDVGVHPRLVHRHVGLHRRH